MERLQENMANRLIVARSEPSSFCHPYARYVLDGEYKVELVSLPKLPPTILCGSFAVGGWACSLMACLQCLIVLYFSLSRHVGGVALRHDGKTILFATVVVSAVTTSAGLLGCSTLVTYCSLYRRGKK